MNNSSKLLEGSRPLDKNYVIPLTSPKVANQAIRIQPIFFEEDQQWLDRVEFLAKSNISNSHYTVNQFANDLAISERQFRRRLKKLTSIGPKQYIKQMRLQHAQQLLFSRKHRTVTRVAQAVGYRDVGSFRNSFFALFGKSPKFYLTQ